MARNKPLVRTYKTFETASNAAKKFNTLALLHGFNKDYTFLVYSINRYVNGHSVSTWVVGTKDYKSQTDDMLYVVKGKAGLMPFRLKFRNYCRFWKD